MEVFSWYFANFPQLIKIVENCAWVEYSSQSSWRRKKLIIKIFISQRSSILLNLLFLFVWNLGNYLVWRNVYNDFWIFKKKMLKYRNNLIMFKRIHLLVGFTNWKKYIFTFLHLWNIIKNITFTIKTQKVTKPMLFRNLVTSSFMKMNFFRTSSSKLLISRTKFLSMYVLV